MVLQRIVRPQPIRTMLSVLSCPNPQPFCWAKRLVGCLNGWFHIRHAVLVLAGGTSYISSVAVTKAALASPISKSHSSRSMIKLLSHFPQSTKQWLSGHFSLCPTGWPRVQPEVCLLQDSFSFSPFRATPEWAQLQWNSICFQFTPTS